MKHVTTIIVASQRRDDRDLCRGVLSAQPDMLLTAEAASFKEMITKLKVRPRVALIEQQTLLRAGGPAVLPAIHRHSPHTRVLLLSDDGHPSDLVEALCLGAVGYVARNGLTVVLPKAVRAVARGEAWVPRTVVGELVARLSGLGSAG